MEIRVLKQQPGLRAFVMGALLVGLPLATTGCGSAFSAICEEQMQCLDGNEMDIDACEVSLEATEESADIYGCGDEFELLTTCLETRAECTNDQYLTDKCVNEQQDVQACFNDSGF